MSDVTLLTIIPAGASFQCIPVRVWDGVARSGAAKAHAAGCPELRPRSEMAICNAVDIGDHWAIQELRYVSSGQRSRRDKCLRSFRTFGLQGGQCQH